MQKLESLEQLSNMWIEDSRVDPSELGKELARIPNLHAKYAQIAALHKQKARIVGIRYKKLRLAKHEYFTGKMAREELKERGWDPFQQKLLNAEVNMYLDSDDELNALLLRQAFHSDIEEFCKAVLWEISARTRQMNAAIDWTKQLKGYL
jgi:hypothetical protein